MSIYEDENFTSICSTITLQSEKEGFFKEFYDCVRNACGDKWIKNEFKIFLNDRAKLYAMFEDPNVCDVVLGTLELVKPVFKGKDAKVSMQRRNHGDSMITNGDMKTALLMYSQAVMRAPPTGENNLIDSGLSLALALWNRSKILLELNHPEKAIQDLQYTVKNGFPIKHRPEYYWRLAKCYSKIGEYQKAKVSFNLTEKLLQGETDKLKLLKEDLQELENSHKNNELVKISPIIMPQLTNGENESLSSASKLLKLETNQENRYVVAADRVHTGDTILVENPFAACLLPKYFGTHCYECLKRLIAPIGCSNCSGIAFCSVDCKDIACSTYHQFECKYLDLLIGSGMSILCHLALRIILQTQNNEILLNDVRSFLNNLCKHSKLRQSHDYFQRTLMSAFLLRFLQQSGFFGRRKTESVTPSKNELDVGELLLGLIQALQFNAHEICEQKLGENHRVNGGKTIYIGVGIYKTGSLFNHSCVPGVARYFLGKTIIFNTVRPLQRGEMVSENYGPIFTKVKLAERQRMLKSRYWFKCECMACVENWPTLNLLNSSPRFKCLTPNCKGFLVQPKQNYQEIKCFKCKEKINLKASIEYVNQTKLVFEKAALMMEIENTKEAIEAFKIGVDLFYDVAIAPYKETQIAQESLRVCYSDQGTTV